MVVSYSMHSCMALGVAAMPVRRRETVDVDVHLGTGVEMDMVGRGCVQHWLVYMHVEVCTCGGERHVVSAGGGGGADTVPAPAVRVAPARPASHGAAAARVHAGAGRGEYVQIRTRAREDMGHEQDMDMGQHT